jgi:hypothetical protein
MLINQTKTYYNVNRTGEIAKSKVSVNMIYWKESMKTNILIIIVSLRSKQYLVLFKNGVNIEGFLTLYKIKFDWLNNFGS